jgi:protein phosphatase
MCFKQTISNSRDVTALLDRILEREVAVNCYVDAYRRYCWNVQAATDSEARPPFHLLASEGHLQIKTAVRYETRRQMY